MIKIEPATLLIKNLGYREILFQKSFIKSFITRLLLIIIYNYKNTQKYEIIINILYKI
jgi:hypothetical protein